MNIQIHGHRGARGRRPENTLAAVEYALRRGADGVEVDLCVSADDVVVVHHDLQLNPATTRDGKDGWITRHSPIPIRELSLAQLREYDVGRLQPGGDYAAQFAEQTPVDGAQIPTLEECVEAVRRHDENGNGAILNLELKRDPAQPELTPPPVHYTQLVTEQLKKLPFPAARIFLQSFDWQLAEELKKHRAKENLDWKIGLTRSKSKLQTTPNHPDWASWIKWAKQNNYDILSCDHRTLTQSKIQQAHDLDLNVCAWTVNQPPDIEKTARHGVDIITTDYPERCREVIGRLGLA